MDDVVIELSDSNSSHAPQKKFPTQAATPTVEAATKAPAVEEPSSSGAPAEVELNEDSCSRDLLDTLSTSKKARRDLTKPQKLRPTLKQTPISVSDSADESSDASPLVKPNRTKSDTPPSSAPSHQVAKRTKKQIAAKSVEATAPVDTPKRPSLLMARRKFLKPVRLPFHPHKRTPAQLAVDKERARTKCPSLFFLPVPVPQSSPKPGSEAQEDPPSVEESVEVVKELPQSSPEKETSQTAEETKVPVTTPDDAPSEAATVEPTPAQGVESPAEIKSAPEGDSIRVETQAAPVETDSEQNKRQTLATEKQLQSNSENGNQSLEEKIFKKVKPETETENREKQEAEVAAEGAAKQDAKKATRLGRKDEHSHAREEVLPAAKRVTRKGSSVEKTTEASDSERPRRRGRKSISEKQPILEDKEANMDTVQRRGRKPSKEVDEANPEPETSKSNPEKPKRRGRQPSAEEAKDIEAKNKEEEILNTIEEEEMPSEQSKLKRALLPSTTEARPETAKRGGRLPSAEKNEPQEAKAQEIVLPNKDDHTVDSELRKPPKEAAKDDTQNPKALGLLLAIKEDQPAGAGAEPMKPLKRTRKSSERVKTKQASQPTATKEDQTDAQADRPKRRGRKPSVDVELAALDVPEKPRRRGQKADAADKEPALTKRMALAEPVDPHLEKITKEIEQEPEPEPEPKNLLLDEEEQKTRRRGRKPTTETVDVPEEHVETTSSRRRGRKATVEEAKVGQAEPKSKRHSAQGAPLEAPVPEIQEASTASVKPARRGRKPSMDVDLAEKKKPTRAVRKPSASIDEGTSQANKTTARRGRKASAKEEGIDSQLTNQDVPTGIYGVYSSASHIEDERTPRRRSGRNIPRKNYKEVSDDDSSGTRCNRKPVTLPDPTTSQRRERRNLPRKNYTEPPDDDDDDDKPTPSRSRRQRNPTVKTLELIVDTTPRPATSRRRKGKAGAEEPHEEDLPVKKTCTELAEELPAVATTAAVKGRGTRRKVENVAEAESAEMEEAEPRAAARKNTRGNARKAKVGTDSDSEAQPAAKKARGGARAKTPVRMISDGEQPEPTKEPAVAVAAKKPAPIFEPEAEQPAPSTEPVAPTAPMTRSRAKKVLFEATPAVAESASSNDEAPKRALRPRRK
ncbi:microtubule-associated protein futsch-like [Drosophila obscura]|uniref:microtubule-associated protein futsch-like n=1 Tax=Drosophila obscura TaxID=7282 RepID=UPI001BB280F8|nr:microtubule-associated protein futsch-like [Drosophila obscura]